MKVQTGLDILSNDKILQQKYKGNIALLCHNASIDAAFTPAPIRFREIFV